MVDFCLLRRDFAQLLGNVPPLHTLFPLPGLYLLVQWKVVLGKAKQTAVIQKVFHSLQLQLWQMPQQVERTVQQCDYSNVV